MVSVSVLAGSRVRAPAVLLELVWGLHWRESTWAAELKSLKVGPRGLPFNTLPHVLRYTVLQEPLPSGLIRSGRVYEASIPIWALWTVCSLKEGCPKASPAGASTPAFHFFCQRNTWGPPDVDIAGPPWFVHCSIVSMCHHAIRNMVARGPTSFKIYQ